jgi:hypothetical protein
LSLSTIALAFVANGLALASVVLLQNFWAVLAVLGVLALDFYLCYLVFAHKRKLQYPLVPPEGKQDMYLPRTNIPRPVIEDFREIEEKKRKFARLNKMVRKVMKPKKK